MDINDIRTGVTVLGFLLFLLLVVRTWGTRAQSGHQRAAELVFEGECEHGREQGIGFKEVRHG